MNHLRIWSYELRGSGMKSDKLRGLGRGVKYVGIWSVV